MGRVAEREVDYGLRPARNTCREWLENLSWNNPENESYSRSAKKKEGWTGKTVRPLKAQIREDHAYRERNWHILDFFLRGHFGMRSTAVYVAELCSEKKQTKNKISLTAFKKASRSHSHSYDVVHLRAWPRCPKPPSFPIECLLSKDLL